jgi:uncharacterized protein (TIGR03067 family)
MTCFSLIVLALTFPTDAPTESAVKNDLQRFQGSWQAASIVNNDGQPATAEDLKRTRLIVEGSKFTLQGKDYTITGSFTIDPARTPKTIDVVLDATDGGLPTKLLGIYSIDGETRKSCFALPDKERPARFPDSSKGYVQFEWKPAPGSAPRK